MEYLNHIFNNGPLYRRLDGRRFAHETDKIQGHEQSQFSGVNSAIRMQSLLGGIISYYD